MTEQRWMNQLIPVVLGLAAGIVAIGDAPSEVRVPIVLGFLAICPGAAIVGLLKMDDPLHQLTLALAISLTLGSLVSLVALYAGLWSPNGILIVLILITIAAAMAPSVDWADVRKQSHRLLPNKRQ